MLELQHRMSHPIQELVSSTYGSKYRPHPSVATQKLSELPSVTETWLSSSSRLFIDTAGYGAEEERDPISRSLRNPVEAELIGALLQQLKLIGVSPTEIALLAPYSAQVALLRARFPEHQVYTINAFQGQEAEVIVCSFVRSNPDGILGFVSDQRRLTVALTRARRLWIGVGDTSLLAAHSGFELLFDALGADLRSAWEELF
jgi:ATP-dependent RNA/DNA helicase IGHMBP2